MIFSTISKFFNSTLFLFFLFSCSTGFDEEITPANQQQSELAFDILQNWEHAVKEHYQKTFNWPSENAYEYNDFQYFTGSVIVSTPGTDTLRLQLEWDDDDCHSLSATIWHKDYLELLAEYSAQGDDCSEFLSDDFETTRTLLILSTADISAAQREWQESKDYMDKMESLVKTSYQTTHALPYSLTTDDFLNPETVETQAWHWLHSSTENSLRVRLENNSTPGCAAFEWLFYDLDQKLVVERYNNGVWCANYLPDTEPYSELYASEIYEDQWHRDSLTHSHTQKYIDAIENFEGLTRSYAIQYGHPPLNASEINFQLIMPAASWEVSTESFCPQLSCSYSEQETRLHFRIKPWNINECYTLETTITASETWHKYERSYEGSGCSEWSDDFEKSELHFHE